MSDSPVIFTPTASDTIDFWRRRIGESTFVAHFQPIVATDTGLVFAHEALGRYQRRDRDSAVSSLGAFFGATLNASTRRQDHRFLALKRAVDRQVREDAIAKAAAAGGTSKLFINIAPSFILSHLTRSADAVPYTIELVRKYGIDPRRIVLEITEEHFNADPEDLIKVIDQYRAEGFAIALDDVGSASSNLDRIGYYHPDIIKIDFRLLKKAKDSDTFKNILYSLSHLAERVGSDILFEGVEGEEDLGIALTYGARYLQGYLFSKAQPVFADPYVFKKVLDARMEGWFKSCCEDVRRKHENELELIAAAEAMALKDGRLDDCFRRLCETDGASRLQDVIRIFETNLSGKQLGPNFCMREGEFHTDSEAAGRNWSYRPYFFDHLEKTIAAPGKWTVSSPYRDIELGLQVRTLGLTDGQRIIFIDLAV